MHCRPVVEALEDRLVPAPFAAENLIIYRVGDGTGPLTANGNPVFLDEYTPTGVLVQSIPLPTEVSGADRQLIASGTAVLEGQITLSVDNQFLVMTGYAANLGGSTALAGTTATAVNRVIGLVDVLGTINTTTALSNFASTDSPRSAVSVDGTRFWGTGGNGGVRTALLGATTATIMTGSPTNFVTGREVGIFNGQLYVSSASGAFFGVNTVGTGLPITGPQPVTPLP